MTVLRLEIEEKELTTKLFVKFAVTPTMSVCRSVRLCASLTVTFYEKQLIRDIENKSKDLFDETNEHQIVSYLLYDNCDTRHHSSAHYIAQ